MDLRERRWGGMDWFDLAQYRSQWFALVNTVMNFQVSLILGYSSVAEQLLASQEGHSSMVLVS
jgi:hypothetical protein